MTRSGRFSRSLATAPRSRRTPRLLDALEPRTLFAVSPIGSLDAATVNAVAGWAYDADAPYARLTVNVKLPDNGHTTSTIANSSRPDLTMLPDVNHGYGFVMGGTILREILPNTTRTISATALSVGGGADTTFPSINVTNHLVGGSVDLANGNVIAGWAYDPDTGPNPFSPDGSDAIFVSVVVNGSLVSRQAANVRRDDLAAFSFGIYHGYSVSLAGMSFSSAPSYQVWFEDSTALYNGSPFGTLAGSGTLPPVVNSVSSPGAPPLSTYADFAVTFSQPVTGVDPSDFQLVTSLSGAAVSQVTGSGSSYTVRVFTGNAPEIGSVRLKLADNDSILGATGLPLAGASSGTFTSQPVAVDRLSPQAQISTSSTSPVPVGSLITWTVVFTKDVFNVDPSDFRGTGDTVTPGPIVSVTGSGTTYTVVLDSGTTTGMITLQLVDDDSIRDALNNPFGGVGDNSRTGGTFIRLT